MKRLAIWIVNLGLVALPTFAQNSTPVTVTNDDPNLDICGFWATVTGLNPDGDNFLALRTGPSTDHDMIAKLPPETRVVICDQRDDWYGVVIWNDDDCGLEHSEYPIVVKPYEYHGQCRSGWVNKKYLGNFAGKAFGQFRTFGSAGFVRSK